MKDVVDTIQSMGNGPAPIGSFLKEKDVEAVARTLYNRFDYTYGLRPSWPDNEKVRNIKKNEVRKVLDALAISGFKVVPMGPDEERLPKRC